MGEDIELGIWCFPAMSVLLLLCSQQKSLSEVSGI